MRCCCERSRSLSLRWLRRCCARVRALWMRGVVEICTAALTARLPPAVRCCATHTADRIAMEARTKRAVQVFGRKVRPAVSLARWFRVFLRLKFFACVLCRGSTGARCAPPARTNAQRPELSRCRCVSCRKLQLLLHTSRRAKVSSRSTADRSMFCSRRRCESRSKSRFDCSASCASRRSMCECE